MRPQMPVSARSFLALLVVSITWCSASPAAAFEASLTWREVASATGYNVYVRWDGGAFVENVGVGNGLATSLVGHTLADLPLGPTVYFTVTSENAGTGLESRHSNELALTYAMVARVVDSDGDGLTDAEEDVNLNRRRDDGETDAMQRDTDTDGLSDGDEVRWGLDPLSGDSDGDGTGDATDTCHDIDRDGFGVPTVLVSTCPFDNCPRVANADQSDRDIDGLGEPCDPCTNIAGGQDITFKPKVVFRKVNTDLVTSNDVLVIKGDFSLPVGASFAGLDPMTEGARVVVSAFTGETVVDVTVPGGIFAGQRGSRGWKINRRGNVWKYLDKTTARVNGILKVVFKDQGTNEPRRVRLVVKGKKGHYPVEPTDPPVNASVALGDQTAAETGRCAETRFSPGQCYFNASGRILACETD